MKKWEKQQIIPLRLRQRLQDLNSLAQNLPLYLESCEDLHAKDGTCQKKTPPNEAI